MYCYRTRCNTLRIGGWGNPQHLIRGSRKAASGSLRQSSAGVGKPEATNPAQWPGSAWRVATLCRS